MLAQASLAPLAAFVQRQKEKEAKMTTSIPTHYCICQKMYDTGTTGAAHIDRWLDTLDWPENWYKLAYHGQLADSDEADDVSSLDLARKIKWRIEQNCCAAIHYPDLLSDDQYGGREVFTSFDAEKNAENRERYENDLWLATNPWELRKTREYKGNCDDPEGTKDVLTEQRKSTDQPTKGGTVQLSLDPTLQSPAERKALSNIRRESDPTPFEKQMFSNLHRIRVKNDQARRDCWMLVQKTDEATQALLVAWIKEQREKRVSFVTIRAELRKTVRGLALVAA